MWIEIVGIVATLFILVSMCCKTSSWAGTFWLRLLNLVGSVIFVVYGILLPAISTAVLNGVLIFINGYYLIKLILDRKKGDFKQPEKSEKAESASDGKKEEK